MTALPNTNLVIYRGDSAAFELTITREIAGVDTVVDITGATLRFSAKRSPEDTDAEALISKTSTDAAQIQITDAVNGEATVHLVPADTSGLEEVTVLFYDVQVTDVAGKVYTVAIGKLKILLDVTQA